MRRLQGEHPDTSRRLWACNGPLAEDLEVVEYGFVGGQKSRKQHSTHEVQHQPQDLEMLQYDRLGRPGTTFTRAVARQTQVLCRLGCGMTCMDEVGCRSSISCDHQCSPLDSRISIVPFSHPGQAQRPCPKTLQSRRQKQGAGCLAETNLRTTLVTEFKTKETLSMGVQRRRSGGGEDSHS